MKKPLAALLLLGLALPIGCTVEEDAPPDPFATRAGFCDAWAENACAPKVITYCNAKSVEACKTTQSEFCLGLLPDNYASTHAKDCLDAVKGAYEDAELDPDELQIVLHLAAPCDQLSKGTRADGQSCTAADDCDTAGGFSCIMKQGEAQGTCGEPEEVAAGEACDGPSQVCKSGYFCNGENCVAYKKTGVACEGDYQCKPTDHCSKDSADAATGTCAVRADLEEACSADTDCQSNYCVIESGATEGVCAGTIRLSRTEPICENLR